jgi:hypothetical protein
MTVVVHAEKGKEVSSKIVVQSPSAFTRSYEASGLDQC